MNKMKGRLRNYRRFFAVFVAACLTCAMSPLAPWSGSFVYGATLDELDGLGYVDEITGNTFYVTREITDWSELRPILAAEDAAYITSIVVDEVVDGGSVSAGDLSGFIKLGKDLSLESIPAIIVDGCTLAAAQVLPDYNPNAAEGAKFEQGLRARNSSNHSVQCSYVWAGALRYVYPVAGAAEVTPVVKVAHDVTADVGGVNKSLLEYASVAGSDVALSGMLAGEDGNLVLTYNEGTGCYAGTVTYGGAFTYVDYNGAINSNDMSYSYSLRRVMLSTVAAPGNEDILGTLSIKAMKKSAAGAEYVAQAGVEFAVYTDANCATEAKRYDAVGGAWVPVGTLKTGADGCVSVGNMKPGTYYVKRLADGVVKTVTLAESSKAVTLGGGEGAVLSGSGASARVNKAELVLHPDMSANANETMWFTDAGSGDNVYGVGAEENGASYYGGSIFVRSGGKAVTAEIPDLIELGGCRVYVDREGGLDVTKDSLAEAIEYINGEVLGVAGAKQSGSSSRLAGTGGESDDAELSRLAGTGGALIDGETGRGHIKLEQKYLDEDLLAETEFVTEDDPVVPPIIGPIVNPDPVVDPDVDPIVDPIEEPTEDEPVVEPVVDDDETDAGEPAETDKISAENDGNGGIVGTGDASRVWLWLGILIVCLKGAGGLVPKCPKGDSFCGAR